MYMANVRNFITTSSVAMLLSCCAQLHRLLCRYEQEQLKRVKVIHVKGTDSATPEDRERYIFKPTFKSLWHKKQLVQV